MNIYADGNEPRIKDLIEHQPEEGVRNLHREAEEEWIVTSIVDDMVRAKCRDAYSWRQAFFIKNMRLVHRAELCEQECPSCGYVREVTKRKRAKKDP